MSVVLGRNIDAIVVDEEKTAIDCIEYMRNQRAGQATFIPLDTIQVKPVNDKFRSFAKGARLAVDVVQHEAAIERAIHHACGNALVCDNMEVARYVCYEKGQEVKGMSVFILKWNYCRLSLNAFAIIQLSLLKALSFIRAVSLLVDVVRTTTTRNGTRRTSKVDWLSCSQ